MKVSSLQAPAYLTKVKKETPTKAANKPFANDSTAVEHRREKINFKQYLRELTEDEGTDDEFSEVQLESLSRASTYDIRDSEDMLIERKRQFDFGGEAMLVTIEEADWEAIALLERDESITVQDEEDCRWHFTRTLSNHLVLEGHDWDLNCKFRFDEIVKKLR